MKSNSLNKSLPKKSLNKIFFYDILYTFVWQRKKNEKKKVERKEIERKKIEWIFIFYRYVWIKKNEREENIRRIIFSYLFV